MVSWGFVKKGGAWYTASQDLINKMTENGIDFPEKIHGENKLFEYLENNPEVVNILLEMFKNLLSSIQNEIDE